MTFMQYSVQHKNYTPMFDMVPHCQVPRCPPLRYGAALSSLAMSALTISMVSRCPVPRFQSPQVMMIDVLRWLKKSFTGLFVIRLYSCVSHGSRQLSNWNNANPYQQSCLLKAKIHYTCFPV